MGLAGRHVRAVVVLLLLSLSVYAMWTEVIDVYVVDNRDKPVPGATVTITYQRTNPRSASDGVITGTTDAEGKFGTSLRNFVPATQNDTASGSYVRDTYTVSASTYFWGSEVATLMRGENYVGTRRIFTFRAPVVMQTVYIYARDGDGYGLADVPLKVTSPVAANLTTDADGRASYKIPNTYTLSVTGSYKGLTVMNSSPYYDPTGLQSVNSLLSPYGIVFASGSGSGNVTNITKNASTASAVATLFDTGLGATALQLSGGRAAALASENGSVKAASSSDSSGRGRVVALDASFLNDNSIDKADNMRFSVNALKWLLYNRNASLYDVCIDSWGLGNRYSGLVRISNAMAGEGYSVIGTAEIPEANGSREITAAALARCNALITDRRGISSEHPAYTQAEISAVTAFVSSNRSLLASHEPGYARDSSVELFFDVYSDRSLEITVLDSGGKALAGVSVLEGEGGGAKSAATDAAGKALFEKIARKATRVTFEANGVKISESVALPLKGKNERAFQLPALLNITGAAASYAGENCVLVNATVKDSRQDAATKVEVRYEGGAGGVLLAQSGTAFSGTVCQNKADRLSIVAYNQYDRVGRELDISGLVARSVGAGEPGGAARQPALFELPEVGRIVEANFVAIAALVVVLALLFIVRDSVIYSIKCAVKFLRKKR